MANRRIVMIVFAVLALGLIGGLGGRWWGARQAAGEVPRTAVQAANAQEAEVPVEVARVERRSINRYVTYHGTLRPNQLIQLSLMQGGRVEEIPVDVGDVVKAGDLLVQLETRELQAQLRQAEAGVAAATAHLEQLLAGATAEDLRQAQAAVRQAEVELDNARQEYERTERLFQTGAVSRQAYEGAQARLRAAESGVESASASLDRVRRGASEQDIAAAEAQLRQAEAARDLARVHLTNASLRSPIDGVVSERTVEPGETTSPGVPVVTVVNLDELRVFLSVPGQDVVQLEEGVTGELVVEDLPHLSFQGRVHRIDPVADPRTNLFRVEVRTPNTSGDLRAGLYAAIRLPVATATDVLAVPERAVIEHDGQSGVWIVEEGRVRFAPMSLGLSDGRWREVVASTDVSEGQIIVTAGREFVRPGSSVRVQESTE